MLKKIHIDWDWSQFVLADYTTHTGSCVTHQQHELTDIHRQHGGFPSSYCLANTAIHQLWWTQEQLDYELLGSMLNMEVVTVSSILQDPGCVVPLHRDTFYQINKRYPTRTERRVRANIYAEAYKVGHFIQYETDQGYVTDTNWLAGDGFLWDSDVLHLSSNAGMQAKITVQVSGFYKE